MRTKKTSKPSRVKIRVVHAVNLTGFEIFAREYLGHNMQHVTCCKILLLKNENYTKMMFNIMCFAEKSRKIYLNLEINTIFIFVSLFRHNYHPHASGTLFFSENQALEVFNRLLKSS